MPLGNHVPAVEAPVAPSRIHSPHLLTQRQGHEARPAAFDVLGALVAGGRRWASDVGEGDAFSLLVEHGAAEGGHDVSPARHSTSAL